MAKDRISNLAESVYEFIFNMLDNEPEINGYAAGEIAYELQQKFIDELWAYKDKE